MKVEAGADPSTTGRVPSREPLLVVALISIVGDATRAAKTGGDPVLGTIAGGDPTRWMGGDTGLTSFSREGRLVPTSFVGDKGPSKENADFFSDVFTVVGEIGLFDDFLVVKNEPPTGDEGLSLARLPFDGDNG